MKSSRVLCLAVCGLLLMTALYAFQKPFRQYPSMEGYDVIELPADYQESSEWVFARLMYPEHPEGLFGPFGRRRFGFGGGGMMDWHEGYTSWTQDYPRADRHFSQAVRRLTRIQVRSVEQPIMMEDGDDAFNWPWIYAVQVGEWGFTEQEAKAMREYLLRGGFFMADDFHGLDEWYEFESRMKKAFPEYPIRDIEENDPIFHAVYDLNDRYQIPGQAHLRAGYKSNNGPTSLGAKWRGIFDEKGRVMVAITYNSDVGDAWEYADDPYYPERFSDLAIRVGVNYIVYAMTH
jgi:Domain of unknown function (DUF4159)